MQKKIKICSIFMVSLYLVGLLREMEMENSNLKPVEFIYHDVCGQQANVDLVVVTPEQATEARNVIDYLNSTNPDYDFMNSMKNGKYDNMSKAIAQTAIPWLILLLISFLGCISYFYCIVFDSCCPPCKSCRRELMVNPYGKGELLFPLIIIFISSIIVIGTGVAGILFSTNIEQTMDVARCSIFAGIADLMLPGANNWPGIIILGERFQVIGKQLPVFLNETVNLFMNATPEEYQNDYNNLISQNSELMQNLMYQSIDPNDPPYYNSYFQPMLSFIAQGDIPQVQSLIPYTNITIPQQQGFDLLYTLMIQSTIEMNGAGQSIANDQASFTASITQAVDDISNITSLLQNQTNSLYDFTADTNKYGNIITLASRILFGISIGLSVFAIIGSLLLCCKRFYGRFFLHIVWFFYTLIIIPGLLMVAVLYPTTGIMAEICEFTEDILSVRQSFVDQKFIKDAVLRRVILECLYDGGDIITVLKVNDQLSSVTKLANQISSFTDTGSQFITLIGQFNILDKNQLFFNSLDQILIIDYEPYDQNDRSNIATLMKDFYLPTYGTECFKDAFSLTLSSCPNGYPFINSTEAYISTQTSYCFGSYFLIEQKTEISERYTLCSEQFTGYTNLVTFFKQQSQNWGIIVDQESKIIIQNQANTDTIKAQITDINKYINKTATFVQTVADPKQGILSGVQCGFLKTTVQRFQDTLCVSTITTLWKVQLLLAIMTTAMMVGACCSYCAGIRQLYIYYIHVYNRYYGLSHQNYLVVKQQENKYKDIPQQQYQYPQPYPQQPIQQSQYQYPQQQIDQNNRQNIQIQMVGMPPR